MTEAKSYRDQSIDLRSKSKDWFLYDMCLRHERVNEMKSIVDISRSLFVSESSLLPSNNRIFVIVESLIREMFPLT